MNIKQIIAITVAVICMIVIYAFLLTLPVYLLWNAVIPDITNNTLKEITFLQALELNLLVGILFRIWIPHQNNK